MPATKFLLGCGMAEPAAVKAAPGVVFQEVEGEMVLLDLAGERYFVLDDGCVGLGHALLSATPEPSIDERQPCTLDGQRWITADARIDGRNDLAAELRAHGRHVSGNEPDARLILHAYDVWGDRCVEHLV